MNWRKQGEHSSQFRRFRSGTFNIRSAKNIGYMYVIISIGLHIPSIVMSINISDLKSIIIWEL